MSSRTIRSRAASYSSARFRSANGDWPTAGGKGSATAKAITAKSGGLIHSYRLRKNTYVRVLVLELAAYTTCPTEAQQLAMIDAAAETAKQNVRLTFATKG
jgi:hypothetical protein